MACLPGLVQLTFYFTDYNQQVADTHQYADDLNCSTSHHVQGHYQTRQVLCVFNTDNQKMLLRFHTGQTDTNVHIAPFCLAGQYVHSPDHNPHLQCLASSFQYILCNTAPSAQHWETIYCWGRLEVCSTMSMQLAIAKYFRFFAFHHKIQRHVLLQQCTH